MARKRPKKAFADAPRNSGIGADGAGASATGPEDERSETGAEDEQSDNPPEKKTRPKGASLNDQEFQVRVWKAVQEAENYVDSIIAPQRIEAEKYYQGQPFGDEEEGRSQIVLTEVRDTVLAILPELLRIFCGGDQWGEYIPRRPDAVEGAEQATDVANYVLMDMNKGFLILHAAFKDALTKKLGIVTWWAEDVSHVLEREWTGLLAIEVSKLVQENPTAELLKLEPDQPNPDPQQQTYKVCMRMTDTSKKYRVAAVPPENFVIDRRARDPETACDIIGVRDMVPVSDLVEMGFDEEEIREHGHPGRDDGLFWNIEKQQRAQGYAWPMDSVDESRQRVKFGRYYIRVDKDGDGIAELREVLTVGETAYVLRDKVVSKVPFALFCPDPEPHTIYGWSIADLTMDIQRIKSHVLRDIMDSLGQSIFPRTAVVEGQVNMDDVLNKEIGAVIRMRQIGMVQDMATPFVGQQAMPVLDFLDQIKVGRTGVTPANTALDGDILQSTTEKAVDSQISASQARIEMIARVFAETGMTQLYKGILEMLTTHQDKPMMVKLRGKFVPVEPTSWDPSMDVSVNVGLGRGNTQTKMQYLALIAGKQEQVLQTLGPVNPITDVGKYRNTLAKITQEAGFRDPDQFWGQVSPDQLQQLQQAAAKQQVDPNQAMVQIEKDKAASEAFAKTQKIAQDKAKLILDAYNSRDKTEADVIFQCFQLGIPPMEVLQILNRPRPEVDNLVNSITSNERMASGAALAEIGANNDGGQGQ
jgi:hypothetical protein